MGGGRLAKSILWDVYVVGWGEGALWSGLGLFLCGVVPSTPLHMCVNIAARRAQTVYVGRSNIYLQIQQGSVAERESSTKADWRRELIKKLLSQTISAAQRVQYTPCPL